MGSNRSRTVRYVGVFGTSLNPNYALPLCLLARQMQAFAIQALFYLLHIL